MRVDLREAIRRKRGKGGPWIGFRLFLLVAVAAAGLLLPPRDGVHAAMSALPDTSTGFHASVIFNYGEAQSSGLMQGEYPQVQDVWGANGGGNALYQTNIPAAGGYVYHEYYVPWGFDRDNWTANTVAWFKTNHPDWLMYKNDRASLVFESATYQQNQNRPGLDFANPAVQNYIVTKYWLPALAGGYGGISIDENPSENYYGMAGHYTTSGTWVQEYSGGVSDATFTNAMVTALRSMIAQVRAQYPNADFSMNNGRDCWFDPSLWLGPTQQADILLDEQGFQHYGNYVDNAWPNNSYCPGTAWIDKMNAYETLQKNMGKGLVIVWYPSYTMTPNLTSTNDQARFDVQWNLANYLLLRYSHTYLDISQSTHAPEWQGEYTAVGSIGAATDDFHASQGVYLRDFTNGLAIVNPDDSASHALTLPAGKYRDLYGNQVSSYSMPPHSGLVLLLNQTPPTATAVPATATPTRAPATATPVPPTPTPTPVKPGNRIHPIKATATPVPGAAPVNNLSGGTNGQSSYAGASTSPATLPLKAPIATNYTAGFVACGINLPAGLAFSFSPNPSRSSVDALTGAGAKTLLTVSAAAGTPAGAWQVGLYAYYHDPFGRPYGSPGAPAVLPAAMTLTVDAAGHVALTPLNQQLPMTGLTCSTPPPGFGTSRTVRYRSIAS